MEEREPDRQPRCECNFKRRSWDDVLDEEGRALLNILEFPSKVGLHSLHVLVDVWGELASHKRSHYPSSQGWAFRSPLLYVCLGYGWVGYLSFLSVIIKLVVCYICTCVSMHTLLMYCIVMCVCECVCVEALVSIVMCRRNLQYW